MTTAYTSLLGLALPVTGELQGTWGDTVNNYITSYLDAAVAGTQTLSTDADVTLTKTTNASLSSTSSQYSILLFSGARTLQRTVTVPAASKIYTVINKTTGGYAVKVVAAGPTTGITIANGESAVIAWNGSDFIKISNTAGSGSFTDLSVSGNLTLSGGTANGVLYLNASKVATSGSALTFDGTNFTVANGDLTIGTNGKKLYVNYIANNSGTDLNINGSTNQIFAIAGSEGMRLTSTGLGIGTSSPAYKLDVVDTTGNIARLFYNDGTYNPRLLITGSSSGISLISTYSSAASNLIFGTSGVEKMRLDGSGNLGIGTSSFTARLTSKASANTYTGGALALQGAVSGTSYLTSSGGNFYVSNDGSTDQLILSSSGNLGLGVTPSASWQSVRRVLQVGSNVALWGSTSGAGSLFLSNNTYFDGTNFRYLITSGASYYAQSTDGSHLWNIAASGTAGNAISFTQAMTLAASGGLSIGTTTDAGTGNLLVAGNISLATNGTSFQWTNSGNNVAINGASGVLSFYTGTSAYNERARIDSSGNFGIGTTTINNKLEVGGVIAVQRSTNTARVSTLSNESGNFVIAADSNYNMIFNTGGSEKARFDTSGNLLVGATALIAAEKLNLTSTASATYTLMQQTSGITAVYGVNGTGAYSGSYTNQPYLFYTNNTERAQIDSSGNLLVGTTSTYGGPARINVGFNQSTNFGITLRNTSATATGVFVSFENSSGSGNGSISQTNSTTIAYNTSSDRRLKTNIVSASDAGSDIDAINVVSHGWVSNDDTVKYGVIAQELFNVVPQAVRKGDDGEEVTETWGVDYSKLVPMLVKEIQSLRKRLADAGIA